MKTKNFKKVVFIGLQFLISSSVKMAKMPGYVTQQIFLIPEEIHVLKETLKGLVTAGLYKRLNF